MAKKNKIKQIELPMKFDPGSLRYEPELPPRKVSKKFESEKNNWRF